MAISVVRLSSCLAATACAAVTALAGLAPRAAEAEVIRCPLDQIRSEVTTRLPDGWWNTPLVFSLDGTRIVNFSDGRVGLQCQYGPAGNIQTYAPTGADCRAVSGGFDCSSGAAGSPTLSTGPVELRQTYVVNFDNGQVTQDGGDLWFQAETAELLYLTPVGGARIGVGDRSNRGYDGCAAARMTRDRVSLRDVPEGSYVCMRTDEGRISQFRVNGISAGSPKTLSLGYTTWR
jgi:hypothetical protein